MQKARKEIISGLDYSPLLSGMCEGLDRSCKHLPSQETMDRIYGWIYAEDLVEDILKENNSFSLLASIERERWEADLNQHLEYLAEKYTDDLSYAIVDQTRNFEWQDRQKWPEKNALRKALLHFIELNTPHYLMSAEQAKQSQLLMLGCEYYLPELADVIFDITVSLHGARHSVLTSETMRKVYASKIMRDHTNLTRLLNDWPRAKYKLAQYTDQSLERYLCDYLIPQIVLSYTFGIKNPYSE